MNKTVEEVSTDMAHAMQITDHSFLVNLALEAAQRTGCRDVVEVGTWRGDTAKQLADAGLNVYCVDTWEGSSDEQEDCTGMFSRGRGADVLFRAFCKNIGLRLHKSITPVHGDSVEVAKTMDQKFALVFLDADHGYRAVRADIEAWWPLVLPGGFLAGHDYGVFDGVTKAVEERFPQASAHMPSVVWYQQKE